MPAWRNALPVVDSQAHCSQQLDSEFWRSSRFEAEAASSPLTPPPSRDAWAANKSRARAVVTEKGSVNKGAGVPLYLRVSADTWDHFRGGVKSGKMGGYRGNGSTMLDKNVERLLSEPWGAAQAGVQYNKEVLGSLCEQFSRLEPQARRGALQGTLFMRKGQRVSLKNEVRTLVDLATDDKDQWVSLIARALGGLRERFDLQQLQQDQ